MNRFHWGHRSNFKPSAARQKEQFHMFDPKGIPGIFAGYEITPGPGVKWSCQYRVWAASDMTKQNYSFDAKHVIEKLRHPHLTERIEIHLPITFPCEEVHEGMSTTLDGLAVKDRLDRSPDFIHDQEEDDDDEGGDDDQDDGGDQGGKARNKKFDTPETCSEDRESRRRVALLCVLSSVLSYVCFPRCAFICLLSYVCSHLCALCVLSRVCSHDAVSLSKFHPQHCLGPGVSLPG